MPGYIKSQALHWFWLYLLPQCQTRFRTPLPQKLSQPY